MILFTHSSTIVIKEKIEDIKGVISEVVNRRYQRGNQKIPKGFSLNIFYLLKYAKRIRNKLNKLMKSSPTYNKLQHYLIEHAFI